jgi:hypothetical protein
MKIKEIKKVEDFTGRYWAFIDENGEEVNSCRRSIALPDEKSDDGYTYEEAKQRAKLLENNTQL